MYCVERLKSWSASAFTWKVDIIREWVWDSTGGAIQGISLDFLEIVQLWLNLFGNIRDFILGHLWVLIIGCHGLD